MFIMSAWLFVLKPFDDLVGPVPRPTSSTLPENRFGSISSDLWPCTLNVVRGSYLDASGHSQLDLPQPLPHLTETTLSPRRGNEPGVVKAAEKFKNDMVQLYRKYSILNWDV